MRIRYFQTKLLRRMQLLLKSSDMGGLIMMKEFALAIACTLGFFTLNLSFASNSPGNLGHSSSATHSSTESLKYNYEVSVDFTALYVRDTAAGGASDTGGRLSLGGMFTSWIGMDGLGLFEVKSKSYLVGGDIRLVPINWLYFKAGAGAYSNKETHELKPTPIIGAGFKGNFTEYYYMLAEGMAFQTSENRRNIGFGVGLGLVF